MSKDVETFVVRIMYIMNIFHINAIQVYIFATLKQRAFCLRQFNEQYFVTFIKLGSRQRTSEICMATALTECCVIIIIVIIIIIIIIIIIYFKNLVVTRDTSEDG